MKNFLSSLLMAALFIVLTTGFASAQFPVRPTEYNSICEGSSGYLNPPYAYDDNFSTYSYANVFQGGKGSVTACEIWYGFPSTSGTQMVLNVNSAAEMISTPGRSGGEVKMLYSLDGGSTWNAFYYFLNSGSISQQTNSVSLANNQDLTKIRVEASCWASVGYAGYYANCIQQVFEIWVSGS